LTFGLRSDEGSVLADPAINFILCTIGTMRKPHSAGQETCENAGQWWLIQQLTLHWVPQATTCRSHTPGQETCENGDMVHIPLVRRPAKTEIRRLAKTENCRSPSGASGFLPPKCKRRDKPGKSFRFIYFVERLLVEKKVIYDIIDK
jgi:hypothetical protein